MTAPKKYDYAAYQQEMLRRLKRNVRHLRKEMNLTVEEAAQRAGIYWRHWQKIESGKHNITLRTLTRLAKCLKVGLDDLLGAKLPAVPETSAGKQSRQRKKKFRSHVRCPPVKK